MLTTTWDLFTFNILGQASLLWNVIPLFDFQCQAWSSSSSSSIFVSISDGMAWYDAMRLSVILVQLGCQIKCTSDYFSNDSTNWNDADVESLGIPIQSVKLKSAQSGTAWSECSGNSFAWEMHACNVCRERCYGIIKGCWWWCWWW